MIFRLENGKSLVGDEQLANPKAGLRGTPLVKGSEDPGWSGIALSVQSALQTLENSPTEQQKAISDLAVLNALCDSLKLTPREAGDRRVWHNGTVLAFRDYVHARWTSGALTTENRMLGDIRRNAFAHLWWTADALGERELPTRSYCERLYNAGDARLRLWIIDFEPFYGRPLLARAAVDHCITNGIRGDEEVDSLFKAIGAIAAVSELSLYEEDPAGLIAEAESLKSALLATASP